MDQPTANSHTVQSFDNPVVLSENNGIANANKEERKATDETEMKTDEITLTVDQEDGQKPEGR